MTFSFTAKKREGKPEELRAQGKIPGVLYGSEIESVSLEVENKVFEKLFNEAGESSLIDFKIEGSNDEPTKVLIQAVQYDPVKQVPIHFDLRQIKMGVEMHATIDINFIGESQAVKEGGTLNMAMDSLDIKCLPKDLVSEVNVDISVLSTFEDAIHVRDIKLPAGITVVENLDSLVAKVAAPMSEEQLKAMEEVQAPAVADIEVEGGKKSGSEEAVSDKDGDKKKE